MIGTDVEWNNGHYELKIDDPKYEELQVHQLTIVEAKALYADLYWVIYRDALSNPTREKEG